MADRGFDNADILRRLRGGPPPRLYVIARRSPIPWLQVRRLGTADRLGLQAHVGRLAKAAQTEGQIPPDPAAIAGLLAGFDFSRVVTFGATSGNALIAAAFGLPGPHGLEVAATEEPEFRGRDIGAMLVSQVLGAGPGGITTAPCPGDAEPALLRLLRSIGTLAGQHAAPDLGLAQIA